MLEKVLQPLPLGFDESHLSYGFYGFGNWKTLANFGS